jgi:hypothetical protein
MRRHTVRARARAAAAALTALGLLLVGAGCGTAATPDHTDIAAWRVDSTPLLTIGLGGDDSVAVTLARVTGATRLDDGSLIVADLGETPLALYGADGRLVRRLARKGGGPGEFEYLAKMWRCGDAIFTYDIEGHRISEFALDGSYRRAFRFAVPTGQQVPYASACNASGRFAHLGWGAAPRVAGYHRDTVPLWLTASADGAPTLLDSIPSSERWGDTYQGQLVGSQPLPLGRQPHIAFGPGAFYIATGDAFELRVYDSLGTPLPPIRLADSVPAVTAADVRDFIEGEIAESQDGERARARIEREYAAVTFPDRHAAITALVVDRGGLVWLRTYAPAAAGSAAWRILTPEGREVARTSLPRRLEVFEIGDDYVLGREIDATEGVPVLRLLRLTRTAGR